MFGFSKKQPQECPVDEQTRLWMESSFLWLAQQFGEENIKQKQIVIPTDEFFPFFYDATRSSLVATAQIIAKQMDIDINEVDLEVYEEGIQQLGTRHFTQMDKPGSAGKYFGKNENGKYDVFIETKNLQIPERLAAVLAHEFAHIKLLGESRLEENDEHLTDLTTVVLGLGIFNANSSFTIFKTIITRGHRTLGYLRQQEWGYALALYAYYRQEKSPGWLKYLTPNIKADVQKGLRYIYGNEELIFAQEYALPDSTETDKMFSGKWRGYYTYGKGYPAIWRNAIAHFNIDMTVERSEIKGVCWEDKLKNVFDTPATIEGVIENNYIEFVKTYPSFWFITHTDDIKVKNEPSQQVFYSGIFEEGEFNGKWEIRSLQLDRDGVIDTHIYQGSWMMRKK